MGIILENQRMKVEFNEQTGAIISLVNKETLWQAVKCPDLSRGLVLVYRTEDKRYILTDGFKLSAFEKKSDNEVKLIWDGLEIEGEKKNIQIDVMAKLLENGLNFSYSIVNGTNGVVDDVRYPSLGGIEQDSRDDKLVVHSMGMNGNFEYNSLGDNFSSNTAWPEHKRPAHITTFPTVSCMQPFELVLSNRQGMYIGMHNDNEYYTPFEIIHEAYPAYEDSLRRIAPKADNEKLTGVILIFNLNAHVAAQSKAAIGNVIFNMFEGSWHEGVKTYMEWREKWYKMMPMPSWFRDVDCWMTLHINSACNCIRYKYTELPEIMREAKKYGVKALQLIGWATGGQDGHEPYQDTDPLLGTFEELKAAVKEIREMGIKVLPMCKWRWFDSKYEPHKEFIPYIAKDKFLNNHDHPGYTYQTLGQHLYLTTHDGYQLCHLSKEYQDKCIRELDKIIALDVDGIMYDEFVYIPKCYDEDHGHRPGQSCWTGGYEMAARYYKHSGSKQEFLLCGEGVSDYMSQYYGCNYIRSNHYFVPALRYINNEMKFATCLTGFDDRGMVNQCLAYNFLINYEPFNFKGRLSDMIKTGEYGRKALDLRMQLRDYLWDGIYKDTLGATLKLEDSSVPYIYSVFVNMKNNKKAMVIVNESASDELKGDFSIENGSGCYSVYTPEQGLIGTAESRISVPPRSVVVLVDDSEGGF